MAVKGIRGAITIKSNTAADIREAVVELLGQMLKQNNIEIKNISHVIFTMTKDLNAAFPAKFARTELGFTETAMMCFNEIDVPGALEKCLRILIVLNCKDDFVPQFVYLKGAETLRN